MWSKRIAQDCRYETWQQHTKQALSQLGLKVRYCVSDRAKALVKLALSEMGCPRIADLLHALRELSQGIGRELSDTLFRVKPTVARVRRHRVQRGVKAAPARRNNKLYKPLKPSTAPSCIN